MGRRHVCCHKQKLKKGLWSPEEDEKLIRYITKNGHGRWSSVPKCAGLERCGKSCRLRWINYLRPDLKRGTFSSQEENHIIELHEALGNRWSQIATQLPGRTDNEIKNFWNSCIKKKLKERGIDPNTHKPIMEVAGPSEDKSGDHHQNSLKAEDSRFSLDDINCLKPSAINSNAILHKEILVPKSFPQPAPTSPSKLSPVLRLLPGLLSPGIYGSMDIFKPQADAQSATAPNLKPPSSEYIGYNTVTSCSQSSGSLVAASNQGIPRNTTCFSSILCDQRVLQIEEEISVANELTQPYDNHDRFWDTDDKNPCTMACKNYALDGSVKWSDLLLQQSYDSKDKMNQGIPWQLQDSSHLIYEKTSPAQQPSNISPDFQHFAAVLDQIQ